MLAGDVLEDNKVNCEMHDNLCSEVDGDAVDSLKEFKVHNEECGGMH